MKKLSETVDEFLNFLLSPEFIGRLCKRIEKDLLKAFPDDEKVREKIEEFCSKEEMKYETTKEECQKQIGDNVCPFCGGELKPMETVDNSDNPTYWAMCKHCDRFYQGMSKAIWKIARKLTEEGWIKAYPHLDKTDYNDSPEKKEYYLNQQTSGATRIVQAVLSEYEKEVE